MLADASVGEQGTGSLTSDHPLPSHKEAWPDFLLVLSEKLVLGGFPCVLQYSRVCGCSPILVMSFRSCFIFPRRRNASIEGRGFALQPDLQNKCGQLAREYFTDAVVFLDKEIGVLCVSRVLWRESIGYIKRYLLTSCIYGS